MGVGSAIGKTVAPRVHRLAPQATTSFVHESLRRAIEGFGPMPSAVDAAEAQLREQGGDVEKAVNEVIENHVMYAGGQGFVTNFGGVIAAAVTLPANVAALTLIQCRMVAGIAHLRGYDLADPRMRNAILSCVLGEDTVRSLVKRKHLPAPPMALATAPAHDPDLDQVVAAEVASELISKVAGKRIVTTVGRRVPVIGGVIGGGADSYATWQVGRYAARELRPRNLR